MSLFNKKKKEEVEVEASIKILGSGCAKCNELEANTKAALVKLGLLTEIGRASCRERV